ncbi:MAG: hypothetical protein JSS97_10200 [Actinobacteria bacterium]|nr:hypothetical protein [Actinomycetota bacterium]
MTTDLAFDVTEVEFDVSAAVPVEERCALTGTVFMPDSPPPRVPVVVAAPGGTYSRRYYDLDPPGHEGHSQARYFAERGVVFVALDYLGGGDSSRPAAGEKLTLPVLADAAHAAVTQLREGLADGSLVGTALTDPVFVGHGFSFGGYLTFVQQGTHADYDAVIIFGSSPIAADGIQDLPAEWNELDAEARREWIRRGNEAAVQEELAVYHGASRRGMWRAYYRKDTPEELIEYDEDEIATLVPRSAGLDVMTPGFTLPSTERFECPLFLGFGDSDLVTDPHREPRAYPRCRDITLTVFPETTHLYNFIDSRRRVWDRMLSWLGSLAALGVE